MSIRSVNAEIRTALADKILTQAEADAIVAEAKKGPVTTGETKAVADAYERGLMKFPTHFPPGAQVMPRPAEIEMEAGARQSLMSFFIEQRVPQGQVYAEVKQDIEAALKDFDYGTPLAAAPNVKHLHEVFLKDARPVDGNRTDAFVDTQKKEFFLKVTGAGMAGPDSVGPFWHGPIPLKELSPAERVADKIDAWTLAGKIGLHTTRTHTPRVTDVKARDDGHFDVTLSAINWRDPSDVRDVKNAVVDKDGELVDTAPGGVRPDTAQRFKAAFDAARSDLSFSRSLPLGTRFERVPLERQPGFDTYTFTALVPVGALAPGAPAKDPNEADQIWIERSGGFAGITMWAGPVDVDLPRS